MTVRTLDEKPGADPKKSRAYEMSSSAPKNEPNVPRPTPTFSFLSSQPVISGHPESPPKSNPMRGLTKPCARTELGSASVRTTSVVHKAIGRKRVCMVAAQVLQE